MIVEKRKSPNKYAWLESLFVVILGMYPLRHIYVGLDLWDTGYSYANFQYMGLEHMDSMWLFSTYLANAVGNFLMKLPGAGSLAGMNFYTGLFVSVLALTGYFFCTKELKIKPFVAFIGEFTAISLCWCPTAKLYDYLTYVLFLICVILLYLGLTQGKNRYLFIAGICLGTNVLVRFSNLPEAAMIVAVWAYGVIEALEWRNNQKTNAKKTNTEIEKAHKEEYKEKEQKDNSGAWARTVNRTLWCLGGYLAALAVLFGYIAIRYGLDEYVAGIQRLFSMTDNATDYKPTSMLMGIAYTYVENLYWVVRIFVIILAGLCVFGIVRYLFRYSKPLAKSVNLSKVLKKGCYILCLLLALAMLVWLYYREFCSFAFYSYDSMLRPGILFLILTMLIAMIRIFHRNCPKEEKLISGIVLLVVLLTSIGSNNGIYPSLNNLFLAAPYTIWQCWLFIRDVKAREIQIKSINITVHPFPVKCILTAFLVLLLFQSSMFGAKFVFVEGTGAQNTSASVENNEILKGIQMSPERAEWMSTISAYAEENDLQGKEVILYGGIPSLSYYLQMPPAFNSWSDLKSYSLKQMEVDMAELKSDINEKVAERPVIIVDREKLNVPEQDAKWQLIVEYMDEYGYEQTFANDKFVMWE